MLADINLSQIFFKKLFHNHLHTCTYFMFKSVSQETIYYDIFEMFSFEKSRANFYKHVCVCNKTNTKADKSA